MKLSDLYKKRNSILIRRTKGGLGDIFMHRMMFEDFKLRNPEIKITFACPPEYHQAVNDHPFLDAVTNCKVDVRDYGCWWDTSTACNRYELATAPLIDKHRSDIWAEHCGVKLTRHNMHFKTEAKQIEHPFVLIAPRSVMSGKNLLSHQIQPVIDVLVKHGYFVAAMHNHPLSDLNVKQLNAKDLKEFISIVAAADYVISTDTAVLHCAGGLGKPLVAIFSWADGKVYTKYYPKVELVQRHRDIDPCWTCGPCFDFGKCPKKPGLANTRKPCIDEITSDMILTAFGKLTSNAEN